MSKVYPISQIIGHKIRKQRQQLRLSAKVVAQKSELANNNFHGMRMGYAKLMLICYFILHKS